MEGEQYDPQIHSRIRACLYRGCFSVDSHYCCAGRNHAGFTVLYNFCQQANCPDGKEPAGGLVVDKSGNLYGTTNDGGTGNGTTCDSISVGCGTVFKVTPDGVETVLYSFCTKTDCEDGANPSGRLVADTAGRSLWCDSCGWRERPRRHRVQSGAGRSMRQCSTLSALRIIARMAHTQVGD